MELTDDVCSIVVKVIAKCDKDFRLKPHAASTRLHLGDGILPVSTLVAVDTKFAKQLRKKLAPPPSPNDGPEHERPTVPLLDLILALRNAVQRGDRGSSHTSKATYLHFSNLFLSLSLFRSLLFFMPSLLM